MARYTTLFWAAGLIASVLALPSTYAANLGDIAQEKVFFSVGGPANGSASALPQQDMMPAAASAALRDSSLFTQVATPDEQVREHPISRSGAPQEGPDSSLFTQVSHPGEQTQDHAFDLFGLKKPAKTVTASVTDINGQVVAAPSAPAAASAPKTNAPDPSLFTEVPNPSEQTRDHPFSLF